MSNTAAKALIQPLLTHQYDYDRVALRQYAHSVFAEDAIFNVFYPFCDTQSVDDFLDNVIDSLMVAMPDGERRDTIVIAGTSEGDEMWVGCGGYYTGTFLASWLDIPPTGHQAALRFHEFYKIKDDKITEVQILWDVPELMMHAGVWPMSPSLGREWHVPAPATQDGLVHTSYDTDSAKQIVKDMCDALGNYASGGVEAMRLKDYWHPKSSWYGPSGIGTGRGISGFRNWHQIPFLNGLPNRVGDVENGHLFAENGYVGFTGWPGMSMTLSGDGWLGMIPCDKEFTTRSLDFWRVENGLIRENWVLIDLLDIYAQLGVNVFERMRELAKPRALCLD